MGKTKNTRFKTPPDGRPVKALKRAAVDDEDDDEESPHAELLEKVSEIFFLLVL